MPTNVLALFSWGRAVFAGNVVEYVPVKLRTIVLGTQLRDYGNCILIVTCFGADCRPAVRFRSPCSRASIRALR